MADQIDYKGTTTGHNESTSLDLPPSGHKFKFSAKSKRQDGDVALGLFANAEDLHEAIDPEEERKLIRKVDLIILPLIAVNYAFFYIGMHSSSDKWFPGLIGGPQTKRLSRMPPYLVSERI